MISYSKVISKSNVDLIKDLLIEPLKRIKVHSSKTWRPDVSNFYFSINEPGMKTGTTESPEKGSKMDELIAIMKELIRLTKNTSNELELSGELIEQINKLKLTIAGNR